MDPRHQLRQKILDALNGDETGADAVMRLFPQITEDVDEFDTTALNDTHHQVLWTKWAVARCPLDTGSYQGAARTSPLGY